jgi:hypothetical protein
MLPPGAPMPAALSRRQRHRERPLRSALARRASRVDPGIDIVLAATQQAGQPDEAQPSPIESPVGVAPSFNRGRARSCRASGRGLRKSGYGQGRGQHHGTLTEANGRSGNVSSKHVVSPGE